ncbi:MAG: tRNA (guanosine(46)-N7)-methyltransferase TrmB [Clostridia bacterium]|nr:tRNA (guanosine(46)-N7)-methyltransferase TrmB [Clostridia bacterium]
MRMRKKKHGDERLAACSHLLKERVSSPISSSKEDFGTDAPLALEIGCGKGGFACGMAKAHPEVCFYAMEKIPNVMVAALEKAVASAEERSRDNLRFIIANADDLESWFAPASLDVIYLNFSDPWPKERHAKRRLTYRGYLFKYFRLLKPDGKICFKTDNVGLFDFSLAELEALGLSPIFVTRDLHHSPYMEGNVMTEYEKNFSEKGFPIHKWELACPPPSVFEKAVDGGKEEE